MSSSEPTPNKCYFCRFSFEGVSPDTKKEHLDKHFEALNSNLSLNRYDEVIYNFENVPKKTKCLRCASEFSNEGNMQIHLKNQHKEFNLKCKFVKCPFVTNERSFLKVHEDEHLFRYRCGVCNDGSFNTLIMRDRHHVSEHMLRNLCRKCWKTYGTFSIEGHELSCLGEQNQAKYSTECNNDLLSGKPVYDKNLKCYLCPFVTTCDGAFKNHLSRHFEQMNLGTSLGRRDSVISQYEDKLQKIKCPCCSYEFSKIGDLFRHLKGQHKEYDLECKYSLCPFVTNEKCLLKSHEENHITMYMCDEEGCSDSYVSLGDRDKHYVRAHTNRNTCRRCRQHFKDKIEKHELSCQSRRASLVVDRSSVAQNAQMRNNSSMTDLYAGNSTEE